MSDGRQRAAQPGPASPIPEKLYFKIGEVSHLVGVQAHVLRYWEKEVSAVRPGKSASNQRRYRRKDVEIFREIKRLLYEERYTLAGARRRVMSGEKPGEGAPLPGEIADEPMVEAPVVEAPQLGLRFPVEEEGVRLEAVKQGLRELIELAGEQA